MIDLCEVVKSFLLRSTDGRLKFCQSGAAKSAHSSKHLQEKYSKAISETGISFKNFALGHVWLQVENGKVLSPYKMLPPLFADWTQEQLDVTVSGRDNIANGSAALTAYGKLHYTHISEEERLEFKQLLLKYWESDTLAMVMIWEYFNEWRFLRGVLPEAFMPRSTISRAINLLSWKQIH